MKRKLLTLVVLCTVAVLFVACASTPAEPTKAPTEAPAAQAKATEAPKAAEPTKAPAKAISALEITVVKGKVEARANANAEFASAKVGQRIGEGAEVRTGADGIVAMYRNKLSMVVLDKNSELQVKKLQDEAKAHVTILFLKNGAAAIEHKGKLPAGVSFTVEMPNGGNGSIVGSTLSVSYDPETQTMTATCLTGECNLVRGDQTLSLQAGQAVDVQGLAPFPDMPSEMTTEQANQFLAMGAQLCNCEITIGEIRDTGLEELVPPSPDIDELSSEEPPEGEELDQGEPGGGESGQGESGGGESGQGESGGGD